MSHFGSKQHLEDQKAKLAITASRIMGRIKIYHDEHGYAPSHKEIQDFGISYPYVSKMLNILADEGFIEYGGGSRMIKIL